MNDTNTTINDEAELSTSRVLKAWPVFETADFADVVFDVTQWEDGRYTMVANFYCPGEAPPYSGFSWATNLGGNTLKEVKLRLQVLLDTGLLDGLEVWGSGVIYDTNGEEVGVVDWNETEIDEQDIEEFSEQVFDIETSDVKPTLH